MSRCFPSSTGHKHGRASDRELAACETPTSDADRLDDSGRIVSDVKAITSISELPTGAAVYAMYGGDERPDVAYVGMGEKLRQPIRQHLVLRDSSATTDSGAVRLHPDYVSAVEWWAHASFADPLCLAAAELVAFDVLEPRMRSRGGITEAAKAKADEMAFRDEMTTVFESEPTGRLELMTFARLVRRVAELERRVEQLEK